MTATEVPRALTMSSRRARAYPWRAACPVVLVLGKAWSTSRRITQDWTPGADHAQGLTARGPDHRVAARRDQTGLDHPCIACASAPEKVFQAVDRRDHPRSF